jgi:hypothetical protein
MSNDGETQFHGIEDGHDALDIFLIAQPFQTARALGRGEIDLLRQFALRHLAVLLESGEQFDIELIKHDHHTETENFCTS